MIISKNSSFPTAIIEWNEFEPHLRDSASHGIFKNSILNFIRPVANRIFKSHNSKEIKLIIRLGQELQLLSKSTFHMA